MLCLCLLLFETCIFWKTGEKTEGDIHCRLDGGTNNKYGCLTKVTEHGK